MGVHSDPGRRFGQSPYALPRRGRSLIPVAVPVVAVVMPVVVMVSAVVVPVAAVLAVLVVVAVVSAVMVVDATGEGDCECADGDQGAKA